MEQILQFPRLKGIKKYSADYSQLGEDYIFSRLLPGSRNLEILNGPVRFSGLTICLVVKGEITGEINLDHFTARPNTLLVLGSSSILKIDSVDWSQIDAHVLLISSQFLHDINIDLNALNLRSMIEHNDRPAPLLTPDEAIIMSKYMDILHINAVQNSEMVFSKNIARSIIPALIYQMLQFQANHSNIAEDKESSPKSRRLNYVHDFMQLVRLHHTHERAISFYSEKLFISSKYLSHIIKEATGRSAAEWIDQFVILEAKNMLRFSNKNIQQVAFALNFPTQSSFGKYFKHITGMSPTEYQKS